ncbi:MAG: methyltransferase domain-containing protein [Nitrososphaerales archaeon]
MTHSMACLRWVVPPNPGLCPRHHLSVTPPEEPRTGEFEPTLPQEHVEQIRIWHDRAYAEALKAGAVDQTFGYLGLSIVVPAEVMPITPMSRLLGEAVLSETRIGDRVLDMGTGSGVNGVLAARKGAHVLAVDISPRALDAARRTQNATKSPTRSRSDIAMSFRTSRKLSTSSSSIHHFDGSGPGVSQRKS